MKRLSFLKSLFQSSAVLLSGSLCLESASAFTAPVPSKAASSQGVGAPSTKQRTIGYKDLNLDLSEFGATVPVACWFPMDDAATPSHGKNKIQYRHRISVHRIGDLLAGWDWIPPIVSRDFVLEPTNPVWDGASAQSQTQLPVVLLAHGYLGSRFDLSHLAEALTQEGFVCLACEYPESLSASYARSDGLDRNVINEKLLNYVEASWKPSRYGIVGHSLGCGTVMATGDDSWARVSIAGFPRTRDGRPLTKEQLFVSSMNDRVANLQRLGGKSSLQTDYTLLDTLDCSKRIPTKAAFVYENEGAPNHISFLSEETNNAMIQFLSPLLPLAQTLNMPVLDFDAYKVSRDSKQTADELHPLIIHYLKQQMNV